MPQQQGLQIRRLGGKLGAEVHGVRLSGDLHPATVKSIHAAILEHKVLFFREQHHLDDPTQEAFAKLFGSLNEHPTVPSVAGTDAILEVSAERGEVASNWHADFTFLDTYPQITILRPQVLPSAGGNTLWGNTEAAYDELPDSLKELADKLWTLHTNDYDYVGDRPVREKGKVRHSEVFLRTKFETEQPLVAIHPHTGKKVLIVGNFIQRILGYRTRIRAICWTSSTAMPQARRTPSAGPGRSAMWRCGTTAPRSTARWMISVPNRASCAARPLPVSRPSALTGARPTPGSSAASRKLPRPDLQVDPGEAARGQPPGTTPMTGSATTGRTCRRWRPMRTSSLQAAHSAHRCGSGSGSRSSCRGSARRASFSTATSDALSAVCIARSRRNVSGIFLAGSFQVGAASGQILTRVRAFIEMLTR